MRRFLVSSFLADVTQHIHSLRASGVMLAHTSVTIASDSIAWRRSAGILCTVPEAIGCRAIVPGVYRSATVPQIRRRTTCRRGIPVSRCPEGGRLDVGFPPSLPPAPHMKDRTTGTGRYRSINLARCSGGWRTVRMGIRAGPQGTTGAKEEAVVAVGARKNRVSGKLRSCIPAPPRRVSTGYRLPPPSGSQRMQAGLSEPRAAAISGCRFVRRRTRAKASARRWECGGRSRSLRVSAGKYSRSNNDIGLSTPSHTPTAVGVQCASRFSLRSLSRAGAVNACLHRRPPCGDRQPTTYFHRCAGGSDALALVAVAATGESYLEPYVLRGQRARGGHGWSPAPCEARGVTSDFMLV